MSSHSQKRIVLHIGAHKTASTLLARALKHVKPHLAPDGIAVLSRGHLKNTSLQKTLHAIKFEASHPQYDPNTLRRGILSQVSNNAPHIILTNEDMFSSLKFKYFFSNIDVGLSLISNLFSDYRIKVVVYTRAQADYIESVLVHRAQQDRNYDSLSKCIQGTIPQNIRWDSVMDTISSVVGRDNLSVAPYESIRTLGSNGYVYDFLERLEIPNPQRFSVPTNLPANRGYSALAVEMARRVNPLLNSEEKKLFRKFLQTTFSNVTHKRAVILNDAQKKEIKAIYKESNLRLFHKYISGRDPGSLGYT